MAEKKYDSKLSELLESHYEAVGEYLKKKESFKKIEKEYDKETHQQRKKALEELKKDLKEKETEEKSYLAALDKITKEKNKYDEQDIADFKEAKNSILAAQKYSNTQLEEAIKEEAELANKEYKSKWKNVAEKTQEYTQVGADALGKMFSGMTKYMDETIAKRKKEVEAITKQIAEEKAKLEQTKKDSANDLARKKASLVEKAEDESGDGATMQSELEEMEAFYNRKAEMDAENTRREQEEGYQKMELSETELERYTDLQGKHSEYMTSLEAKTNAEKTANEQINNLEKEKAKKEEYIAKKEKEKKRTEAAQQYIQAGVNIAQGITKALALGPIIGPIMAGIVGAAGAVQLGYMTAQINKLEDGGLLSGKRHRNGGMRIEGTNIEVEGGEYVVNRDSTQKNIDLLRYINSQRRELNGDDFQSIFSSKPFSKISRPAFVSTMFEYGGEIPQLAPSSNMETEKIIRSIQGINFQPRVAVTDIHTVQQQMAQVDEWVGMR